MRKKGTFTVLSLFSVLVLVVGCTDLTPVREWSSTSLEATQYNKLVMTYSNTPERMKRYDSSTQWNANIDSRNNQSLALKELLAVVSDYMAVLAVLSADSTVDYNKDVDTLSKSIGKFNAGITSGNKQISSETLEAAGSLVKTILNAAAGFYQAKQVKIVVEQANEPLQKIIGKQGDLFQIVDKDFRRDLVTEATGIDGYYDKLSRVGNPSDAAKESMVEWKEVRLKQNVKELEAIDAYLEIIGNIATGHQKLYENRNALDSEELVKQLRILVGELRKQISILAQA